MNLSLHVIAVTGPKRSGKNTTAKLIDALGEEQFVQIQLADPIKDGFDRISGPGRELHKDLDDAGWATRRAWQLAGTEARDSAGDRLIWCRVALTWIAYLSEYHPRRYTRFVIPDLRFPHEERFFRDEIAAFGGRFELWRVHSPRAVDETGGHSSESYYSQLTPDRKLWNTGTRWDLAVAVERLLNTPETEEASDVFV